MDTKKKTTERRKTHVAFSDSWCSCINRESSALDLCNRESALWRLSMFAGSCIRKRSCYIAPSTWGLKSNTVRLSLLIKQKEKEQQREHRMRKEAEGRHKQRTIEDLKGNGCPWIQHYWCKKKNKGMKGQRFILWLIILIVFSKSAEEREPEARTETPTDIHKHTIEQSLNNSVSERSLDSPEVMRTGLKLHFNWGGLPLGLWSY